MQQLGRESLAYRSQVLQILLLALPPLLPVHRRLGRRQGR
jgi:hypothetical protein